MRSYAFIDSGHGQKLERFGDVTLIRPASAAIWPPRLPQEVWDRADGLFSRDEGRGWLLKRELPESWQIEIEGIHFILKRTDFGHIGLFPEQKPLWTWQREFLKNITTPFSVCNLFAYSGGASIAAAKASAEVVHLDASQGMVNWARENALASGIEKGIRWIVDDVNKFLVRWAKRGERFEGIICDPPTFGRGPKGQLFKIERDLYPLLLSCRELLSDQPLFFILSCHTPGYTPGMLKQLLEALMSGFGGQVEAGEMLLEGKSTFALPSGSFAIWSRS